MSAMATSATATISIAAIDSRSCRPLVVPCTTASMLPLKVSAGTSSPTSVPVAVSGTMMRAMMMAAGREIIDAVMMWPSAPSMRVPMTLA